MQNFETTATAQFEITTSRQMLPWMAEQKLSIALTTYQIGKLFLLGLKANGGSIFDRTFDRCMGLCPTDNGFYMSRSAPDLAFRECVHARPAAGQL